MLGDRRSSNTPAQLPPSSKPMNPSGDGAESKGLGSSGAEGDLRDLSVNNQVILGISEVENTTNSNDNLAGKKLSLTDAQQQQDLEKHDDNYDQAFLAYYQDKKLEEGKSADQRLFSDIKNENV
jgi:hypothetical protein